MRVIISAVVVLFLLYVAHTGIESCKSKGGKWAGPGQCYKETQ